MKTGTSVEVPLTRAGRGWVQVIKGKVELSDGGEPVRLGPGDGAAIVSRQVALKSTADAEVLVFDHGVPA